MFKIAKKIDKNSDSLLLNEKKTETLYNKIFHLFTFKLNQSDEEA